MEELTCRVPGCAYPPTDARYERLCRVHAPWFAQVSTEANMDRAIVLTIRVAGRMYRAVLNDQWAHRDLRFRCIPSRERQEWAMLNPRPKLYEAASHFAVQEGWLSPVLGKGGWDLGPVEMPQTLRYAGTTVKLIGQLRRPT